MLVQIVPEIINRLRRAIGVQVRVDQRITSDAIIGPLSEIAGQLGDRGIGMCFVLRRLIVGDVQADLGVADHPIEIRKTWIDLPRTNVMRERGRVVLVLVRFVGGLDLAASFDLFAAEQAKGKSQCPEQAQRPFHELFNSPE